MSADWAFAWWMYGLVFGATVAWVRLRGRS
jgi:hypothetical protein